MITNLMVIQIFAQHAPQLLTEVFEDIYCIGFNDGVNYNVDSNNVPPFDENWLNQEYDKNLFNTNDVLKYLKEVEHKSH